MKKLLILLFLALAACTTTREVPVIQPPLDVNIPKAAPITVQNVQWQVLNLDGLKKLVAQLAAHPDAQFVVYTLDSKNFEALLLNMNDLKRYIEEQQASVNFAIGVLQARKDTAQDATKKPDEPKKVTPVP